MEYDKVGHIHEVIGKSDKSWEDAIKNAIQHVYKKHKEVKGVDIIKMTAKIEKGKIIEYKADVKLAIVD